MTDSQQITKHRPTAEQDRRTSMTTPTPAHTLPFDYLGAAPTAEQVVDRDAAELRAND